MILLSRAKLQNSTWHHLQQVFHKLHAMQNYLQNSASATSLPRKFQYLGHVLSTTTIKPLPSKTSAIKLMKPQKNAKQVRAFFGLCWLLP